MKIAFVYDVIYPFVKGGAERRYYELARRLCVSHEVHLLGMKFWEGDDVIRTEYGVYLHGVCPPKTLYVDGRRSIFQAIYYAVRLVFPLLREDFDLVETPSTPFFQIITCKLYSILKKCPLIVAWMEYWGDYWYEYLGRLGQGGKMVEKLATRLPDHIIAISEHTKESLIESGVRADVITSIPLGISLAEIEAIEPSPIQSDLIFAGRLIRDKNVETLIHVVRELVMGGLSIKCFIVGDGPEKKKLENISQSLGLENNITFLGFLDRQEDVYALMKSSKVFVFL